MRGSKKVIQDARSFSNGFNIDNEILGGFEYYEAPKVLGDMF